MSSLIAFRPVRDDDLEFLFRLYSSTRDGEMAMMPWNEARKAHFLRSQFTAQHDHYREQFADASFRIILLGDEPVGRLYVHRGDDEIRIVDIALLPERRGAGTGAKIIRGLLTEAGTAGKPVRLHVQHGNRAINLYQRLGFEKAGDTDVYQLMQWTPPP